MRLTSKSLVCLLVMASFGLVRGAGASTPEEAAPAADTGTTNVLFFAESGPVIVRITMTLDGRPLEAAWNESRTATFTFLDADGNGELSPAETRRYPWLMQIRQPTGGFFSSLFSGLRRSAAPKPATAAMTDEVFDRKYAAARPLLQVAPAMAISRRESDLFDLADADRNGGLTAEELSRLAERATVLDINSDGLVALRELWQYDNPFSHEQEYYTPGQPGVVARPEEASWVKLDDDALHPILALRMIERYAGHESSENSVAITLGDRSSRALRAVDQDSDGRISQSEAEAWLAAPIADLELMLRLGDSGGRPTIEAVIPLDTEGESSHSSAIEPNSFHNSNSAVIFSIGSERIEFVATNLHESRYDSAYKQQFDAADSDNNNYLDETEAKLNGYFASSFARMDRDADGKMYEEELLAYIDQESAAAASRLALTFQPPARSLFSLLDANADERLSRREMASASTAMDSHDANRDDRLETREIPQRHRLTIARAQPGDLILPFSLGSILPRPSAAPSGPRWFQSSDRNRDSEVTWREFRGPRELFNRFDVSGDGAIDLGEAGS